MVFYDSHVHCKGLESGGFVIGLEGLPRAAAALGNAEARALAENDERYVFFEYVESGMNHSANPFLKYHPARERYAPDAVARSIEAACPRAVMIDTLNEPRWLPIDYWRLAETFRDVTFVFCHAGGYAVNEFVKICHLQPNVYIDFSLTHSYFGGISQNPLPYVDQAIAFAVKARFRNRILLGSDAPFFGQEEVVRYYERLGALELLNGNFERLRNQLSSDTGGHL